MSPKIATGFIDEAYDEARKHGALGGKVTGAGGGGYMLFYCAFQRSTGSPRRWCGWAGR